MNEYVVTILTILITVGLGLLLLINFGIDWVIYFGVIIILISIVGSLFYTWWKTQSDKTVERLKVELLIKTRKDLGDVSGFVSRAGKLSDMSAVSHNLSLLVNNLVNQKFYDSDFNITPHISKYTLTYIEQESRKTEQKLRSLEALAAGNYRPALEKYIQELQSNLEKLREAGYNISEDLKEFNTIAAQPSKSVREMTEKWERLKEKFDKVIDVCINEVTSVATASRKLGNTENIEHSIIEIGKIKGDFNSAVLHLVNARSGLKEILKDVFSKEHSHLSLHVKIAMNIIDKEHINIKHREVIRNLRDKLISLNDPGRIQELRELESKFKSQLSSTITELYTELQEVERNINVYQPHEKVWTPDSTINTLVDAVTPTEKLDEFSIKASKALEHLVKQLGKDVAFVKIVENYSKIEPLITRKLREFGRVIESDLNIKYADKFLLFYSLKNQDVAFQEDPPTLIVQSAIASELKEKLLKKKKG